MTRRWALADGEISGSGRAAVKSRSRPDHRTGSAGDGLDGLPFPGACANWLTNPVFDPITQTAEYKACAVSSGKSNRLINLRLPPPTSFPVGGGANPLKFKVLIQVRL